MIWTECKAFRHYEIRNQGPEKRGLDAGICKTSSGTSEIKGGTVGCWSKDETTAVYNTAGTLNIKGGTLTVDTIPSGQTSRTDIRVIYAAGGTVTFSGGTLTNNVNDRIKSGNKSYMVQVTGGTFNVSGGTIQNTLTSGVGEVILAQGGTTKVNGGTVQTKSGSSVAVVKVNSGATLNVTSGNVKALENAFIAINNYGTTKIEGGNVESRQQCIWNQSGATTNITGGTVAKKNTNQYDAVRISGGAVSFSGGNINTECASRPIIFAKAGSFTMTGGKLNAKQLAITVPSTASADTKVTITNGEIVASTNTVSGLSDPGDERLWGSAAVSMWKGTLDISGGSITSVMDFKTNRAGVTEDNIKTYLAIAVLVDEAKASVKNCNILAETGKSNEFNAYGIAMYQGESGTDANHLVSSGTLVVDHCKITARTHYNGEVSASIPIFARNNNTKESTVKVQNCNLTASSGANGVHSDGIMLSGPAAITKTDINMAYVYSGNGHNDKNNCGNIMLQMSYDFVQKIGEYIIGASPDSKGTVNVSEVTASLDGRNMTDNMRWGLAGTIVTAGGSSTVNIVSGTYDINVKGNSNSPGVVAVANIGENNKVNISGGTYNLSGPVIAVAQGLKNGVVNLSGGTVTLSETQCANTAFPLFNGCQLNGGTYNVTYKGGHNTLLIFKNSQINDNFHVNFQNTGWISTNIIWAQGGTSGTLRQGNYSLASGRMTALGSNVVLRQGSPNVSTDFAVNTWYNNAGN